MQETWVQSLTQENPLKKEMATHASLLAWEIPWKEELGWLQSMGSQKCRTQLSDRTTVTTLYVTSPPATLTWSLSPNCGPPGQANLFPAMGWVVINNDLHDQNELSLSEFWPLLPLPRLRLSGEESQDLLFLVLLSRVNVIFFFAMAVTTFNVEFFFFLFAPLSCSHYSLMSNTQ